MRPSYDVVTIDLSTVLTGFKIADIGQSVTAVTVQAIPAGVSTSLVLGANSDPIPLNFSGQTFEMCPGCDEGIFFNNPVATPGSFVVLIISFADTLTTNTA